ncbi:MAG: PadR family transcriptional regulator [Candidatus Eremiobacteraeota bacterium]|nr:PadR family transcriptional regulator [Candidatus Eremiobacteraeota bacterium]
MPFLLLSMLVRGPRHGYDFMREFKERGGGWRPGPGSIYPTLAGLEEAGLVESRDEDGKRVYVITEKGVEHMREHGAGFEEAFAEHAQQNAPSPIVDAWRKLRGAVEQAEQLSENADAVKKIADILNAARKEIYTLLANE